MPDCLPTKLAVPLEGEIILDGTNRAPCIPEGVYEVAYSHHETTTVFQTPKLFVWFRITSFGPHLGVKLYRPYRVKRLKGKVGRGGGFEAGRRSNIYKDIVRMLNLTARPKYLSGRDFANRIWKVRVRTVRKDYQGKPIPEWDRYSVVSEFFCEAT